PPLRGAVAAVVLAEPELDEPLPLERAELLPGLARVDRELVLDHLARERLVPGEAANPVLAGADDVRALPPRRRRRGGAACELFREPQHLCAQLSRAPLLERLGHAVNGTS